MRSVEIKVLKNELRDYVRLASSGETVLVIDRGRTVAELRSPRPGRAPVLADALLAEGVREGWLNPPFALAGAPPPRKPVAIWDELRRNLDADRAER